MISESIVKILEFASKYAWGVMALSSVLIFLPDGAITQMGLSEIRNQYLGIWWLLFIFSTAIWVISPLSYLKEWWKKRSKEKEQIELLENRMRSLAAPEREWLRYCLYFNVQSATACRTNSIPQSMVNKGILKEGSGHVLNLPFHVTDLAWTIAQANIFEFLTPDEMGNEATARELNQFMREMKRP